VHENLYNEVAAFTPEGKSPDYIKSFKQSMQKLAAPLRSQAQEFRDTAISKIEKENILSKDNGWFLVRNTENFIPEYYNNEGSVLMDKAGAQ
jgi:hypothetical protein